jgi:hypothetical protein
MHDRISSPPPQSNWDNPDVGMVNADRAVRSQPSNSCYVLAQDGRKRMDDPMDLLADTRRYLDAAIKQLAAIEAGAPIAKPLTKEQAINIMTEQIGLFESVLRRYGRSRRSYG